MNTRRPTPKARPTPNPADELTQRAEQVKDSAQHIWLAGLGAFAKAQAEGAKVFESLVSEGQQLQVKTQQAAQSRLKALEEATEQVAGMANELGEKASGQWNKLEGIFENRVAAALLNLGMPPAPDMVALQARVQALEEHIAQLHQRQRSTPVPAPKAPKTSSTVKRARPATARKS